MGLLSVMLNMGPHFPLYLNHVDTHTRMKRMESQHRVVGY